MTRQMVMAANAQVSMWIGREMRARRQHESCDYRFANKIFAIDQKSSARDWIADVAVIGIGSLIGIVTGLLVAVRTSSATEVSNLS